MGALVPQALTLWFPAWVSGFESGDSVLRKSLSPTRDGRSRRMVSSNDLFVSKSIQKIQDHTRAKFFSGGPAWFSGYGFQPE